MAKAMSVRTAGSRDSGVEILEHRRQRLERRSRHGLDDELNVPDPFARIGTQLIGDDLRTSLKRRCQRRRLVHVPPAGPTRHLDKNSHRPLDLAGLAAGRDAGVVDCFTQRSDAIGPVSRLSIPGIPCADMRNSDLEHPLARRPDQQRRSARTRPWDELTVAGGIELPGKVDAAVMEQRSNDGEGFRESRYPTIKRKTKGPILRLVPSGAEAKDEAATTDLIHRRGQLREHGGIVEARACHQRPDRDSARNSGNPGQLRPGFPWTPRTVRFIPVQEMITHPDLVEAQFLAEASHSRELGAANVPLHFRKLEADLERPRWGYACLTW